jgi:hypothetical protein
MRRREFIACLGGTAAAWSIASRAQQANRHLVGFIGTTSSEGTERWVAGFRAGLPERGFVEGRNVSVEYNWANNQYEQFSIGRRRSVRNCLVARRAAAASRRVMERFGFRAARVFCGNSEKRTSEAAMVIAGQGNAAMDWSRHYWISSSAVASSVSGMVRPRALTVLRLRTSSTLVDCCTGRSVCLSPLRMRPA